MNSGRLFIERVSKGSVLYVFPDFQLVVRKPGNRPDLSIIKRTAQHEQTLARIPTVMSSVKTTLE